MSFAGTHAFIYADNAPDFSGLVSGVSAAYLTYAHYKQREEAKELIKTFSDFRLVEKPNTFDITNKKVSFGGVLFVSGYYLMAVFVYIGFASISCPDGIEEGCGLLMPIYYPFLNLKKRGIRYAILLMQVSGGFCMAIDTFLITWIYNSQAELLCAFINHLKDMLMQIQQIPNPIDRRRQFRECVKYHHHLIE